MQLLQLIEPDNAKSNCDTTTTAHASGMMIYPSLIPDADKWIIDTGASKHIVHSLSMLTQYRTLDRVLCNKVHLPTGSLAHVSHVGSSRMLGGAEISNVLHIPEFHYNLLSDLSSGNVRGTGTLENDMYVIHVDIQLKTQGTQLKSQ
ncbi:hypothetical protein H5410_041863 [Solanum commersonii]|uniref:Retrovirus-related Pol polyprotein from transposon TNT 1-94-like beta-barrel domain-containing protein n=1 Tax=Solanum commersonii TaxID=4109 RepID=A0A9J5XU41_SOLCO|nr:hypothetical protein H5410_041863 [Solanum commersonii]